MPTLLVVEASPRGEFSISRNLTHAFVEDWRRLHPEGNIIRRDLTRTELTFTNAPWLAAYFTPAERHSPEMKETLRLSDELVHELLLADHVAIGTPVYNYNVPAVLKAWVDHIVRKGITLGLNGEGLLHGKKASVLLASGGVYTEGSPIRDRDLATAWLRLILGVIGITDVAFVTGGGAKVVDLGQETREDFLAPVLPRVAAAAAR